MAVGCITWEKRVLPCPTRGHCRQRLRRVTRVPDAVDHWSTHTWSKSLPRLPASSNIRCRAVLVSDCLENL